MNAENAFLVVKANNKVDGNGMLSFEWDIINCGKTLAFVYETATHFCRFNKIADIPEQTKYEAFVPTTQKTVLPIQEITGDGIGVVGDYEEIKAKAPLGSVSFMHRGT